MSRERESSSPSRSAGEHKPRITQPETPSAAVPSASASKTGQRLSCAKWFDALWFCYSPFHQMQNYYKYGEFDNCYSKWNALFNCLSLKTKRTTEVEEILEAREKSKPHIWTYRTV